MITIIKQAKQGTTFELQMRKNQVFHDGSALMTGSGGKRLIQIRTIFAK